MQHSTSRTAPTGADLPTIATSVTPPCSLEQFFGVLGHDAPHVDHCNPIHDSYCRCTTCKPAAIGTTSQSLFRVQVAAVIGSIGVVAFGAAKIGGL